MNLLARCKAYLLFWLLILPATIAVAETSIPEQRSFNELIYNEVLFKLYQGHYFPAIRRLLTAEKENRLTSNKDEYELLLGGLYLSFGMDDEADEIFKRNLSGDDLRLLRNQALFQLAKIQYQHGLYEKAEKTLKRVQSQLSPAQQEERLLMHGRLLLLRDKYHWSIARLRKIKNHSEWAIYGRYNLAIALLKLQENRRGQKLLEAIGQMEAKTEDMRSLRDRANLALGFWFLENKKNGHALRVLKRVRLNSPATSMGRLGTGWAYARQAKYQSALSAWKPLLEQDISEPAAQEVLLATAYAYLKLGGERQALDHYQQAIRLYQKEIAQLEKEITSLKSGTFFNNAKGHLAQPNTEWLNWAISQSVNPTKSSFTSLLKNQLFISSLDNLLDLLFLKQNLLLWSIEWDGVRAALKDSSRQQIKSRLSTIEKEQERLQSRLSRSAQLARTNSGSVDSLELSTPSHVRSYREMLFNIDGMGDNRHIATGDEKILMRAREATLNKIRKFSKQDNSGKRDYPLFKRALKWQDETGSRHNLSLAQKMLANIELKLSETGKRRDAILMLLQAEKSDIRPYDEPIAKAATRIARLRPKVDSVLKSQTDRLTAMAISELHIQKRRLEGYLVRAHFRTARIQDRALGTKELLW